MKRYSIAFEGLSVWQIAILIEAARAACCPVAIDEQTRADVRAVGRSPRAVPRGTGRARASATTLDAARSPAAPSLT